jgi:hypothetical protein
LGKVAQNGGYLGNLKKLPKVNNYSLGENSPNLVALFTDRNSCMCGRARARMAVPHKLIKIHNRKINMKEDQERWKGWGVGGRTFRQLAAGLPDFSCSKHTKTGQM